MVLLLLLPSGAPLCSLTIKRSRPHPDVCTLHSIQLIPQVDHGVHTLHGLYLIARCPRFGPLPMCQHSPVGVMCTKFTTVFETEAVGVGVVVGSVCVVELVVVVVVACDVALVVIVVVVVRSNCK